MIVDNVLKCIQSGDLDSKACRKVLANAEALAELREECQKPENEDKDVCEQLNLVPGLPTPSDTGGDGPLDPVTSGLPRAGHGATSEGWVGRDWSAKGPTMRELVKMYDPSLVALLVPGMVVSR